MGVVAALDTRQLEGTETLKHWVRHGRHRTMGDRGPAGAGSGTQEQTTGSVWVQSAGYRGCGGCSVLEVVGVVAF